MQLGAEIKGQVCVVSLTGRLDTVAAPDFDKSMAEHLGQDVRAYLLDLGGLEYVSSAGLRSLLVLAKKLQASQRKLVLCGLNELIDEVFDVSGFKPLFTICAGPEEGIQEIG